MLGLAPPFSQRASMKRSNRMKRSPKIMYEKSMERIFGSGSSGYLYRIWKQGILRILPISGPIRFELVIESPNLSCESLVKHLTPFCGCGVQRSRVTDLHSCSKFYLQSS